jgi:hypothetical protein
MSMTPDERIHTDQALVILRSNFQLEREKRREWQAYALVLEQQMQREGWTQGDFDDLPIDRPE